jgi:hypothetical protein
MRLVPRASGASINALWEIDLSPGTRTVIKCARYLVKTSAAAAMEA